VGGFSLEELKAFDFGQVADDSSKIEIPTFKEALETIPESMGLNIQIKEADLPLLEEVCRLFDLHDLYRRAYLTMSTFEDAEKLQKINERIELCILERKKTLDQELLKKMAAFGCAYLQPHRRDVTPELCAMIRETGFHANMFYSNTDEDNRRYIAWGMQGIMTDAPDILLETIKTLSSSR
jgi:glycerophosphoryl diester phosphodiesterase